MIIPETGADMSIFPTAKHLASWAGTTPGNNESAGKVKSSRTRPGDPPPAGRARCRRDVGRPEPARFHGRSLLPDRGQARPQRANVAVQHTLLTAIWNMNTTGTLYEDLGGDDYSRLNPERTRTRTVRQLAAMGCRVTLDNAS